MKAQLGNTHNAYPETAQDVDESVEDINPSTGLINASDGDTGERQPTQQKEETMPAKDGKLNMVYTLFWSYLMTFLVTASFLWADLIPGFGLVAKPSLLGKQLVSCHVDLNI